MGLVPVQAIDVVDEDDEPLTAFEEQGVDLVLQFIKADLRSGLSEILGSFTRVDLYAWQRYGNSRQESAVLPQKLGRSTFEPRFFAQSLGQRCEETAQKRFFGREVPWVETYRYGVLVGAKRFFHHF